MADPKVSLVDIFSLEAPFATELRRLLQTLKNNPKHTDLKSILITSSTVDEGKSTICCFLGMTAAKKGHKTLLIDADLRRPTLHRNFNVAREGGLVEILSEGVNAKSVIKKGGIDLLDLITAGKAVPQPAEVFDSKAIGALVSEMKFYYDMIVVDCAPVIPVSDPMLLAQELDGVIMVVKAGVTQREVARRAADILGSSGGKLLGVVVNNMSGSLPSYYDYTRYEYQYQPRESDKPQSKPAGPDTSKGQGKKNSIPR